MNLHDILLSRELDCEKCSHYEGERGGTVNCPHFPPDVEEEGFCPEWRTKIKEEGRKPDA